MTSLEVAVVIASLHRAPKQRDLLLRVVASNGGGLSAYTESRKAWEALHDKGLVQGKSGNLACIVHTPLGLAVARAMNAPQELDA